MLLNPLTLVIFITLLMKNNQPWLKFLLVFISSSLNCRTDISGGHYIRNLFGGVVGLQVQSYSIYHSYFSCSIS